MARAKSKKESLSTKASASDLAKQVNGLLGAGTIRLGSDPSLVVTYLPTGVLPIDVLLQGGLPRGRFTEAFGDFSTLKSFVGMSAIAHTQDAGGRTALIDTEHAYDPSWAEQIGVDPDRLMVLHPPTGEDAVDATELLIRSGTDLIVWDSVAATLPQTEREKRAGDPVQPARLAALMSAGMRKLTSANSQTAILCINQTRINVGQMFGSPESVPGGKALPFYASYRVALRKAGKITREVKTWDGAKMVNTKETVGQKIRATLEKSKLNSPHRESWFTWDLQRGAVDDTGFLIAWGLENGIVIQEGQMWRIKGLRDKTRGAAAFRGLIDSKPKIKNLLREQALGGNVSLASNKAGSPSEGS